LFSGEFDTVIFESDEAPKVIDAMSGIILPPKHVTELDRLAFVVNEIDRSCSAIPTGALKYTPLHQVIFNEAFKGLRADDAFNLSGWKHFRRSECKEQCDLIARNEAFYSTEFLDPVSVDMPKCCWSVQKDTTQCVAILRNHMWQGYYGYHRVQSPIYGGLYVGDGIANIDLPFMV
jgi:radial spoke head protein 9